MSIDHSESTVHADRVTNVKGAGRTSFSMVARVATWMATGFGAGRVRYAPGTVGTAVAIPLYLVVTQLSIGLYALIVVVSFLVGVCVCELAGVCLGKQDHQSIVWDEIVGYLIAMWLAPPGWTWIIVGFVLFRLFDICKPFPIRYLERLPGGIGVMADDVLAGLYAWAIMHALVGVLDHPLL